MRTTYQTANFAISANTPHVCCAGAPRSFRRASSSYDRVDMLSTHGHMAVGRAVNRATRAARRACVFRHHSRRTRATVVGESAFANREFKHSQRSRASIERRSRSTDTRIRPSHRSHAASTRSSHERSELGENRAYSRPSASSDVCLLFRPPLRRVTGLLLLVRLVDAELVVERRAVDP